MARSLLVIDDFFIEVGEAVWLHTLVIDAVSMESGVAHAALAALQDQLRAAEAFRFLKTSQFYPQHLANLSLLFQNVPNSIRELNEHPRLEHIMCHVILQNSFKELLILNCLNTSVFQIKYLLSKSMILLPPFLLPVCSVKWWILLNARSVRTPFSLIM